MTNVLIVDDNQENLYYLTALLRNVGCEVETAQQGAEALVKARRAPPAVVISDLLMPVMDGYTLLRHWKADLVLKHVPFIVYTGTYKEAEDEQLALRLGADAFILKPAEPDEFLRRLGQVQLNAVSSQPLLPHEPIADEQGFLKEYNETLIRKLEERSLRLRETNHRLQSDIVMRERAELELRASETRFRLLTEVMPQLVWITLADGCHVHFNQRWTDYTGLSALDSSGKGWSEPFHPEDRPRVEAAWRDATTSGQPYSLEARMRSVDGSFRWWLVRGLPLRDDSGSIVNWFGTCTDVDELKLACSARDRAEREASERAAVLRALFDSVPDVVTHLDLDGNVKLINRAPGGSGREPPDGVSWLENGPPEQRDLIKRAFDLVVSSGQVTSFEWSLGEANGATSSFWNTLAPVSREGRITGVVVVCRDISDRKQAEVQLIVSDRMASVGTLAAGVAHEINNPLACVVANLALVTQELDVMATHRALPRDLLDEVRDARDGAERVRTIVRDLKIFSRSEDAKVGPVDVEQALESTLRMAWNELRHRARVVKIYGKVPPVRATESRLGQVLLNLVMNAAQAIPEGNYQRNEVRVETSVDATGRHVLIKVSDTGGGIPLDVQRRLFTPFFTTKPAGMGTGLGLSLCRRIVTGLGGTVDFSSEVGRGTTFRVSLPIADLDAGVEGESLETHAAAARRGRVLVIDDEAMITNAVSRLLRSEHDVVAVHSVASAMELFQSGEVFDVVLCDLMMPQVTGLDLHASLLELDPRQAARMVFMTGGAFTPKARAFLDSAPNQRIEKPFDAQGLRALVNGLVA
jgi:PAS domain S-box-containing protein